MGSASRVLVGALLAIALLACPASASAARSNVDLLDGSLLRLDGAAANAFAGQDDRGGAIGDIDGDGLTDFATSTPTASPNGRPGSGSVQVTYGRAGSSQPAVIGSPEAGPGFRIDGAGNGTQLGGWVTSAGDVNDDRIDDMLLRASVGGPYRTWVVYGSEDRPTGPVDLAQLTPAEGFTITAGASETSMGYRASGAGDVNGDGVDDILLSGFVASPQGRTNAGRVAVIYGQEGNRVTSIDTGSLDPSDGFHVDGANANDWLGISVRDAGDVDGDGIGDLVLGARQASPNGVYRAGSAFVVYGRRADRPTPLDLSTLAAQDGFRIDGAGEQQQLGTRVTGAGDADHDGLADIAVGAPGASYNGTNSGSAAVIYGSSDRPAGPVTLGSVPAARGYRIDGASGTSLGQDLAGAGDFDGDGLDDLVVSARQGSGRVGKVYVVFGSNARETGVLQPAVASTDRVVRIDGESAADNTGSATLGLGDFNGDGGDDLLLGASNASYNGSLSGSVYVVGGTPQALADAATVDADSAAAPINVLANDRGPATILSVTQPANGTVVLAPGGGSLTYKPNAGYCNTATPGQAKDTFSYTRNGGASATVRVTVQCAPPPVDPGPDPGSPSAPPTTGRPVPPVAGVSPPAIKSPRPRLARTRLSSKSFSARGKRGLRIRFGLSRRSTVLVATQQRVHGRWRTIWVFGKRLNAGARTIKFSGRITPRGKARRLRPGRYRLRIRPSAGGVKGPVTVVGFRVRR